MSSPATLLMDHPALLRRAEALVAQGRLGAARPLLAALQKRGAPAAECAMLQARIAMKEGHGAEARSILDAAVAQSLGHAGLRKCRAELLSDLGEFGEAVRDAAEAVIYDPADPQAKALLGGVLLALGHYTEARECLAEAAAMVPASAPYAQALAAAEEAGGDPGQAASTLATGIARARANRNLRTAAILLALRHGQGEAAHALAESARAEGLVDAAILGLAGHALSLIGRHDEAAESYAEALKLGPKDDYVRHLVAAAGGLPGAPRAPLPYVRAVFNGYARHFELHMASLGYRGPGLVRAAVQRHLPVVQDGALLDLGCGSGFVAVALSDLGFKTLCGVDVARAMLEVARSKGLYTELHEADVMERLVQDENRYDVVAAADVLCYFGELMPIFVGVRQRLRPDGIFIATVETVTSPEQDAHVIAHAAAASRAVPAGAAASAEVLNGAVVNGAVVNGEVVNGEVVNGPGAFGPDVAGVVVRGAADPDDAAPTAPWRLGPTGRYQHAESHISAAAAAAGLRLLECTPEVLRYEADQPVAGLLLVFGRQDD